VLLNLDLLATVLSLTHLSKMARRNSFDEASAGFRAHLPDLSSPRFTSAAKQNPYEYTKCMQENRAPPWLHDLTKVWEQLLAEPYKGVTHDGTVKDRLYEARDEGFNVDVVTKKAKELLGVLSNEEKGKISFDINAREWRAWSNPEFLLRPFGLRLEEGGTLFCLVFLLELTLCSPRKDCAVYLKRYRSLALTRRLPKSARCHAGQSLFRRSGQAPQYLEQIFL
jgi:hypothetical protein